MLTFSPNRCTERHFAPTQFRDEYFLIFFTAVVLLAKIMRGGEYDVMILATVQTYFLLFREGI